MRRPLYNTAAPKQTVSLTINGELYARAKKLELNVSQIAEQALADVVQRLDAEQVKAEIAQELAACDAYAAKHGSFVEMMREYYDSDRETDDEPARRVSESKPARPARIPARRRVAGRRS
jgi:post-segregation antitoxin (ccd killing protein)